MEFNLYIEDKKVLYSALMNYIEAPNDSEAEFEALINVVEKQKILQSEEEIRLFLQLISRIADNHHRTCDFFDKFEKIISSLIKDKQRDIYQLIPDPQKYNKRLLLFLFEQEFVIPNQKFLTNYFKQDRSMDNFPECQYFYYLYPGIKKYLEDSTRNSIEQEISQKFNESIESFEKKCHVGENDSHLCSLIRQDSVKEFISFVNFAKISLKSRIIQSIFETNNFLNIKVPSLIEYATFYGAIQIVQYLKYTEVEVTFSLWPYAIHSNNPEMIQIIKENTSDLCEDKNKFTFKGDPSDYIRGYRINNNDKYKLNYDDDDDDVEYSIDFLMHIMVVNIVEIFDVLGIMMKKLFIMTLIQILKKQLNAITMILQTTSKMLYYHAIVLINILLNQLQHH